MYVDALLSAVRNRSISFKVTPKGDRTSPDRLSTFSHNLFWAALVGGALALSFPLHHAHPFMRGWAALVLLICVAPVLIWWTTLLTRRSRPGDAAVAEASGPAEPGALTTTTTVEQLLDRPVDPSVDTSDLYTSTESSLQ